MPYLSFLTGFAGGVYLPEDKLTKKIPIEVMPAPKRVYIPFSQHIGKPARPLVKEGEIVKTGAKIGESEGAISASVHTSISGKVVAITPYEHPTLGSSLSCIIESIDQEQRDEEGFSNRVKEHRYENLTKEELLSIIKDAGIVGLGGGAFPTHVKLSLPIEKPIHTLIINGCESEPMLTADHRLMLEYPVGIIEGAKIFQKVLQAPNLVFAIEKNKKDAAKVLKKEGAEIRLLKTKYPQGAEKQLIKAVLNREVPPSGLPMDVGCVVQNVGTCYAGFQAVNLKKPLIERVVTVTGDGVKEPKNLLVRIGTPVLSVLNFCGGYTGQPKKIIFGGPMTGIAQYAENVPIIKGTSGIIVLNSTKIEEERPCVRCAHCVDACPMQLMPCEIYKFLKHKKFNAAKDYGLFDCIECGSCAYLCPAKVPLVHYFKYGKFELQKSNKILIQSPYFQRAT